jgi:uncharacterized damage-inducible protein DinB
LLSSWGVAFEEADVASEPAARAALDRLGIPLVPAVVAGDRHVHGWNPTALAALLGVAYVEPPRLPPAELARRLDRVLRGAGRALAQVPPDRLDERPASGRERSVRQLAFHLFRVGQAYPDAMAAGHLPQEWLQEQVSPQRREPAALLAYGASVRTAVAAFLAHPGAVDGRVETYYGPQTAHQLLERTTWHAAQHLRQLYAFLERCGVSPEAPLGEADWAGLPLPREL